MKEKIEKLASQVIPKEDLKSFLQMSIKDQVIGLAVLAVIGEDFDMKNECLELLKTM